MTVDDLLAEARAGLPHRPSPVEACAAQARGALLVDILGDDQRRAGGLGGPTEGFVHADGDDEGGDDPAMGRSSVS